MFRSGVNGFPSSSARKGIPSSATPINLPTTAQFDCPFRTFIYS